MYRVFEANELHKALNYQNFKNRYPIYENQEVQIGGRTWVNSAPTQGTIINDPFSKRAIEGPIQYFALYNPAKPFVFIGTDISFLKDPEKDEKKKFMDLMFKASDGDAKALNQLGIIYKKNGSPGEATFLQTAKPAPDMAEYFFKKSIEIAPTKDVLFNLGALYFENNRGREAEQYLNQALGHGSARALFFLGVLYEKGMGGVPANKERAKGLYEDALTKDLPADIKMRTEKRLKGLNSTPQRPPITRTSRSRQLLPE